MDTIGKKKDRWRTAIRDFASSGKSAGDYLSLMLAFHAVIRPGEGLIWSEVEQILKEEVK